MSCVDLFPRKKLPVFVDMSLWGCIVVFVASTADNEKLTSRIDLHRLPN